MMLQAHWQIRQKAAQMRDVSAFGLADAARWGSVHCAGGGFIKAPSADLPIPTPSLVGRASVPRAGPPDFSSPVSLLQNRRRFAHQRITAEFFLHHRTVTGFVPLSVKSNNQGWAGCEQQRSLLQLRFARVLWRVAIRPANRRFTARGPGISVRSSLMAIRCLVPPQGLRPTCFIARQVRASAADPLAGKSFSENRPLPGPIHNAQRAVPGHLAPGGALRLQHLKTKEARCSTRS